MSRPAWRLDPVLRHGRAPVRLSAQPERDRQGVHRRAGLRRCAGRSAGRVGVCSERRRRPSRRGRDRRTIGIASPWADSESTEPLAYIEVKDRSVATSGNSQRGFRINGRWYSHIFDPRSGVPVDRVASATVIAERAVDADALAKVFNVLEPEESLRLADSLPGVECLIVAKDGRIARSDGWSATRRPRPAGWPSPMSRSVRPKPRGTAEATGEAEGRHATRGTRISSWSSISRSTSPEAAAGPIPSALRGRLGRGQGRHPVRTLSLWVSMGGAGPFQWLPDLKRWYPGDQERKRSTRRRSSSRCAADPASPASTR